MFLDFLMKSDGHKFAEGIYEMGFVKPSKVQVRRAGGSQLSQGRPVDDLEGWMIWGFQP